MLLGLTALLAVAAYCLGSISSAILASRLFRLPDPRTVGSNNPGATNVLRSGNKKAAIVTLIGDCLKGILAVWLARILLDTVQISRPETVLVIVAVMAFIGHLYPVFFNFKGGKGVATFIGVLLALHWLTGLLVILLWLTIAATSRYSALAAITAALASPFIYYGLTNDTAVTLGLMVMVILLLWRHQDNLLRLIQGTESKIKLNQTK